MIQVTKNESNIPQDFLDYVESKRYRKVDFDSGRNKSKDADGIFQKFRKKKEYDSIKSKLINDQGYICCYCNARVLENGSTIEHIIPKSIDHTNVLEYSNLLIACNGGREERKKNDDKENYPNYCDAFRGSNKLDFSPLENKCWLAFHYDIENGSISGNNFEANNVINTLNLNCNILKKNRKSAYEVLFDDIHELLSNKELEMIWDSFWEKDSLNMYNPYFYSILYCIYNNIGK